MTQEQEDMLATAKRAIADADVEIKKQTLLRDTWLKIAGKMEGELYGRIFPPEK